MSPVTFSPLSKWAIGIAAVALLVFFLVRVQTIAYPFVWAVGASYVLNPIVNYGNSRMQIPRFWVVALVYLVFLSLIIDFSRYVLPFVTAQIGYFVEDSSSLEGRLIHLVGPSPLGINIDQLVAQGISSWNSLTGNPKSAEKVLATAANTTIRVFIFLVTTFYLLVDGPRIRLALEQVIPIRHRPELLRLAYRINATWMGYIRGELLLFGIMAVASGIGLELLRVPGALPLAIATGALELLPVIGPFTAGALAVSLAYFNGSNPFGWSQVTYAVVVAAMYFVLREAEDYLVIPKVLGRAVRLHPLVVLFALAAGGLTLGPFGLLVAVPVAASLKIIAAYLYDKLTGDPPQFLDIHAVAGDEG